MSTVTIDRHVLASSASSINLAWRSFGWTPAIAGARATRLEEEVPWGTLSDRSAHPGWLTGPSTAIADPSNLDRLQWAFLPMDGRMGLSVWGAAGDPRAAPGSRRVLTHTLLFDEAAFVRLAGYPFGLFGTASRPAGWLRCFESAGSFAQPEGLEALRLELAPALTRAFETARIAEVRRLRQVLLEHTDGDAYALAYRVARIHEALARTRDAETRPPVERVALRDDGQGAPLLVRLAWLALPLSDRIRTWFSTEQARTERPRAHLMVLPRMEWGRSTPPATLIVNPDDADEEGEPSPGRARWAAGVAGPDSIPSQVMRRADARGWSVLGSDDTGAGVGVEVARLLKQWRDEGPSLAVAGELLAIERGRMRPRTGGVGAYLARAVWSGSVDEDESARELVELCRSSPRHGAGILKGAVRALLRRDGAGLTAALARCLACEDGSAEDVLTDLARLGGAERSALEALLDRSDGLAVLLQALTTVNRAGVVLPEPGIAGIRSRLRQPGIVARALGADPVDFAAFLDVIGDPGTPGSTAKVEALGRGVDVFPGHALAPRTLKLTVAVFLSSEAGLNQIRIWHDSAGQEGARLQILTHPDWREAPDGGQKAYGAAAGALACASDEGIRLEWTREWLDILLGPWLAVVGGGGRLDGLEALSVAELIWRRAELDAGREGVGEAAPSGQRSGGEVLGSPAVSPSAGLEDLVHSLSTDGLAVLLRHLSAAGPAAPTGMLATLLSSPAISTLHQPEDLDLLLRQLWAEWTPDLGVPSLRRAVVHHGPALAPLLDRLRDAPAPIPLGAVLGALRTECAPPTPAPRPDGPRTLFLRSGGG